MPFRFMGVAAVCITLSLFAWTAVEADQQQPLPVPVPKLEDLPGPVVDPANLPAPAQWPVPRYDRPLRMLAVSGGVRTVGPPGRDVGHRGPSVARSGSPGRLTPGGVAATADAACASRCRRRGASGRPG
jgi:hypothetical protein